VPAIYSSRRRPLGASTHLAGQEVRVLMQRNGVEPLLRHLTNLVNIEIPDQADPDLYRERSAFRVTTTQARLLLSGRSVFTHQTIPSLGRKLPFFPSVVKYITIRLFLAN
jgi:hypothetical protein